MPQNWAQVFIYLPVYRILSKNNVLFNLSQFIKSSLHIVKLLNVVVYKFYNITNVWFFCNIKKLTLSHVIDLKIIKICDVMLQN